MGRVLARPNPRPPQRRRLNLPPEPATMPAAKSKRPPAPARRSTSISDDLRSILARRGSAYGVAKAANLPHTVVSRFLNHERSMNLESLDALAATLGLRLVEVRRGRSGGRAAAAARAVSGATADEDQGDVG